MLALAFVIGATLVTVFSFEQATLRPLTEYLVETATERAFSIDGDLDARAGRSISIRAERISLGNADWGSSEHLLSIEEAEVSIDLLHLLGGVLAIDKLEARGVKLLVEQDEQGRSNWAMGSSQDLSTSAIERERATALPIIHSQLSDIDITVKNTALLHPLEMHLDLVEHSAAQSNELRVTVVGAIENRPLNLDARIGPLTQLFGAGAVDFDVKAGIDTIALEASGQLDNLYVPRRAALHLSVVTPEIAQVFTLLGLPQIVHGASELRASMQPSGDHHTLELAASIDALNLDARARLPALDTIDGASIALSAAGPDLAAAARLAGLDGLPTQAFEFESSAALSGRQLTIGETRFDTGDSHLTAKGSMSQFPSLNGTSLELQLVGKNYLEFAELLGIEEVAKLQPEPFEVRSRLEYSARDLQQFTAQLRIADVSGDFSGELTGDPTFVGSRLDYRLDGRNDALIQQLLGRPTLIEGSFTLQGSLQRTRTGYGIERGALSFGANQLEVGGAIGEDALRAGTDLSMRFHGPDLDKIAAIAGYTGFVPAGIVEINAAARAQDNVIHLGDLSAQLGRSSLKVSGLIGLQDGLAGSRVQVALAGEDIADVLPPDLLAYVDPQQTFELTGTLATDAGKLAIDALRARLGEVNLEASAIVSTIQPLTDTSITLDARGPDLAAIIPQDLLPYSLPADKFSVSGDVALTAKGLTLDGIEALIGPNRLGLSGTIPIDTPTDGLNLVVTASGPNLKRAVPPELDQYDFTEGAYEINGNIQLAGGVMSLRQLDVSTSRGRLSGQLGVSVDNPRQFGEFDLKTSGKNLDEFLPSIPGYTPATVPFDLDARGSWDSNRVIVQRGVLELDDASINVQGEVELRPNAVSSRLTLSAHGDNMADLGQFQGLILPEEEFRIEAALQGGENNLEIPELKAYFGESDLSGSLQIEFADKPQIRIDLESQLLDLEELLPAEDVSAEAAGLPQPPASDGRLIPQLPVPVDQLNRLNLETRIRLGELRMLRHTLRNIEIDADLLEGKLTVSESRGTATEGQIIASFEAVAHGQRIVISGELEGKDIVLGKIEDSETEDSFPEQDFRLEYRTSGATARELAENLNGYAQLTGGAGRLRNRRALGLFGSFYSELLSAINPFVTREPYTAISCFAAYAEITDGVAVINPGAVLQTDKLNIFARGQVDLHSEQIALRFDTSPRSGIGISVADFVNPFVGVSGTLTGPRLGVDPKNAMFEGGFAYATGGLSIVAKSLFNRWFGSTEPCASIEQKAQEYLKQKQDLREEQITE